MPLTQSGIVELNVKFKKWIDPGSMIHDNREWRMYVQSYVRTELRFFARKWCLTFFRFNFHFYSLRFEIWKVTKFGPTSNSYHQGYQKFKTKFRANCVYCNHHSMRYKCHCVSCESLLIGWCRGFTVLLWCDLSTLQKKFNKEHWERKISFKSAHLLHISSTKSYRTGR